VVTINYEILQCIKIGIILLQCIIYRGFQVVIKVWDDMRTRVNYDRMFS